MFEIKEVDTYEESGCKFYDKLLVVKTSLYWKSHPKYGEFGSMSVLDVYIEAKKYVTEKYKGKNLKERLGIPDLVMEIIE